MAAPVIPCDSCGRPIPDSDLETGSAVTLLGKRYCAGCKTEAIQNVSLEDLASPSASAPAKVAAPRPATPGAKPPQRTAPPRPAAPKPAPAAPPPAREPDPLQSRSAERRPAVRRSSAPTATPSRTPMILGGAAVAAALVAAGAFFAFRGGDPLPEKSGPGKTEPSGTTTLKTAGQDRETQAREAYAKVEELTRRANVSWDLLLAAIDRAKPACRGTEWEKRLEEIRTTATREKETEDAGKELAPLFDELKGAVATDPEFKRYVELQPKFQLALEMASKSGSVRRDEIRALQREYNGKYEKLAEPYYNRINEAANALADERRFDDALREISSFPQHLRHSGAWMSLEKLRQDIEKRKKK